MLKFSEAGHKNHDSNDILQPSQENSTGINNIHKSGEGNIFNLIFSMKQKESNEDENFHQTKLCIDTFQNVQKATGILIEKYFLEVKKKLRLLRLSLGKRYKNRSSSSTKIPKWKKKHSKN